MEYDGEAEKPDDWVVVEPSEWHWYEKLTSWGDDGVMRTRPKYLRRELIIARAR